MEGEYDISLVNMDGSNLTTLTYAAQNSYPVWASDSSRIAYISGEGGTFDIYIFHLNDDNTSSQTTKITDVAMEIIQLEWSWNDKVLLFIACSDTYRCDLYSIDLNGTNLRNLTTNFSGTVTSFTLRQSNGQIAFVASQGEDYSTSHIYTIDGEDFIQLTSHSGDYTNLQWSSTNPMITFAHREETEWDIYTLQIYDDQLTNLTAALQTQSGLYGFDWSLDETQLVFSGLSAGNQELYIYDNRTELYTQLTHNNVHDVNPQWIVQCD
jgi:Tol biopolymer transport system component